MMVAKSLLKRVLGADAGDEFLASPPLTRFQPLNADPGFDDVAPLRPDDRDAPYPGPAIPTTKRLSRFRNQHTRYKPDYMDDVARSARSLTQNAAMAGMDQLQTPPSRPPMPAPPPVDHGVQATRPDISAAQLSNEGADMIPIHVVMQAMSRRLTS